MASFASWSRYSTAVRLSNALAGVAPGSVRIFSSKSNKTVRASFRTSPKRRSARRAPGLCRWHISRGDAVLLDAPAAAVVRLSDLLLTAVELAELKGSRKHRAHLAKALLSAALQGRAIFPGVTVQRRPAGSRSGSSAGRLLWTRHAPAIVPGRSDLSRARRLLAALTPEQELALVNAATAALEAHAPDGGLEVAEKDLLVDLRDYARSLQRTAR